MADNIFGLEVDPKADDSLYENEPEETTDTPEPEVEAPEAEAGAPEVQATGEPSDAAPPPPAEEETPSDEVEAPVEEEPQVPEFMASDRDLSKFKSVEALGEGYRNAILLHNRSAQRAREAEANAAGWQETAEKALAMLQARQTPAPDPSVLPPDIAQLAKETGVDEDVLRVAQALVNRQSQSQTLAMQSEQVQREMAQRSQFAQQQLQATVQDFFTRHPEVTEGSDVDMKLGQTIAYFRLDPSLPDALEVAYELVSDPELEKLVRANPHWIDNDEGMAYAREQLAENKRSVETASTQSAAQNEVARQAALRKAAVETGSGTPPTSPGGENDEWAQVLAVARKDRGAEDIFGLGS